MNYHDAGTATYTVHFTGTANATDMNTAFPWTITVPPPDPIRELDKELAEMEATDETRTSPSAYAADCEHDPKCELWIAQNGQSIFICNMSRDHASNALRVMKNALTKWKTPPTYDASTYGSYRRIQVYIAALEAELARRTA